MPDIKSTNDHALALEWYVQFSKVIEATQMTGYFEQSVLSYDQQKALIHLRSEPNYFAIASNLINDRRDYSLRDIKDQIKEIFLTSCLAHHICLPPEFLPYYPDNFRYHQDPQLQMNLTLFLMHFPAFALT